MRCFVHCATEGFQSIVSFLEEGANGCLPDLCVPLADRVVVLGISASLAFAGERDGWVRWRGDFGARWGVGELGISGDDSGGGFQNLHLVDRRIDSKHLSDSRAEGCWYFVELAARGRNDGPGGRRDIIVC